jgi:hypothetical protein
VVEELLWLRCSCPVECMMHGEGVWIQKPETEWACLVLGMPCETAVRSGGLVEEQWWWCGCPIKCVRRGEGVWVQNPEQVCSVSGMLCKTAVWSGGVMAEE